MNYVPGQHFNKNFAQPQQQVLLLLLFLSSVIPLIIIIAVCSLQLHCIKTMGKIRGTRLPGFCLNRIRPHARVRSPPMQQKAKHVDTTSATKIDQKTEEYSCSACEEKSDDGVVKPAGSVIGRKIMIVVDSSLEAKGAVQWALTHTVQNQDTIVLLHVMKPSKQATDEASSMEIDPRAYELASSFKNMCNVKRPEVQIEIAVTDGKEKGPKIVEEAKKHGVALLVLGQKKRSTTWRLLMMWAGHRVTGGVVEYCIQNAHCMAIAVRRKGKKIGGYMITTKRHKDFWLLA